MQIELQHIPIHGHLMAFRKAGSGPVILLLHGMAGSSATWRHVLPALAREFTVVAPDLLGHGQSAKPRTDYSPGAYATGIRDLMAALGHERATVIGQSFGGGIAMQFAYQYPKRCERLVLVGSGGLGTEVNALLRALSIPGANWVLPMACRPSISYLGKKIASWVQRRGKFLHPVAAEIARSYSGLADAATRRAFVLTLRSVIDHQGQRVSARDRLYLTSKFPVLIVWGEADRIIPVQHAIDTHLALPGSRLELFPGVGHFPHCEDPRRFVRVIKAFIHETVPAKTATQDL